MRGEGRALRHGFRFGSHLNFPSDNRIRILEQTSDRGRDVSRNQLRDIVFAFLYCKTTCLINLIYL